MSSHVDSLCQPLLEHAAKVLSKDVNKSGQRLYDHWCRRTRKECFMASYQNEFFRAAYCQNRLGTSARSYVQAAQRIRQEVPGFAAFLRTIRHVVSIGCGPGSDAVGLLAFLRDLAAKDKKKEEEEEEEKEKKKEEEEEARRLVFFMIDQCQDWCDYIAALDSGVGATDRCSLWFKTLRFKDVGHEQWLPPADMIVFSFANTALMDPGLWPLLVRRYRMVLVLDSVRETLKDEYDDCKFASFQLNDRTRCYYHCGKGFGGDEQAAAGDAVKEEAEEEAEEEKEEEEAEAPSGVANSD